MLAPGRLCSWNASEVSAGSGSPGSALLARSERRCECECAFTEAAAAVPLTRRDSQAYSRRLDCRHAQRKGGAGGG